MNQTIEHQPRERAVPCTLCRTDTWNLNAVCDRCECPTCHGDRIIEVPVYGRIAAEATRVTRCPKCSDGKPVRATS